MLHYYQYRKLLYTSHLPIPSNTINPNTHLGAVYILRQPPEGGEGVSQMLTIADEGGRVREKFDKVGLEVLNICLKETS